MSKRKTPKTSTPAPNASGLKLARELMGLILLFFGLYILLSLVTFDVRDPGFNHAISTAKGVRNSAGVIGSYLGGMLTDIFGVAAYIWPVFILVLAARQLFFRFSVQWWRCLGFICLLLCFMMASTAWKFQLGDIIGGGLIGDAIYGITWKFLSGTGSFLLGLCFFLMSLQLMFNISWLALLRALWLWIVSCWNDMRVGSIEPDGDEPDDSPTSPEEKPKKQESKAKSADKKQIVVNASDNGKSVGENTRADGDAEVEPLSIGTTEKTGLWSRIKNSFLQATQKQSLSPNTVQEVASEQNSDSNPLVVENLEVRPIPSQVDKLSPHSVVLEQNIVDTEQGSSSSQHQEPIHFLRENTNTCPNPFAAPWARACDIQAEWAQPVEPVVTLSSEHAANCAASGVSDQSKLLYGTNKPDAVLTGPNGGLLVTRGTTGVDAPQSMQDGTEQGEFVFDSLPENVHKNTYQQVDIVENQTDNTADFEIDLDASMAVLACPEASFEREPIADVSFVSESVDDVCIDDASDGTAFDCTDGSTEHDEQSHRDAIAATLRDLQTILDVQPNAQSDVQPDAKPAEAFEVNITNATDGTDALAITAQDDGSLQAHLVTDLENNSVSSEQEDFDISCDYDNVGSDICTQSTDVTEDFVEDLMPDDDIPPSFEVLMDADKDGITDLTEEEVGTGGAAKAAPVKIKTRLPHLDLLQDAMDDECSKPRLDILTEKGERLTKCLADFGIQGELTRITPGPVVTMFEFRPAPGVKVSRIANLSDDLALALKAIAVRIQAPIPGTDTVGIEIPNEVRETIYFKDLLASETFHDASSLLTLAVGKDSAGRPSVADLAKMPHLLVAGATGAGKSVCLNSILLSFLYKARPEDVQLLLIDPKRIELAVYADLPHLVHPVVTDMSHAKNALEWAVHEMDKRYEGMARLGVRNIAGYNQKLEGFGNDKPIEFLDLEFMPYLVIIIDELADLMLTAAKEVETSIVRLAQLARAAGIHMVLATQRPSVDVVTGLIKANFPCRISFQVTSKHDSRTILDTVGAEHLLGRGDMLFKPSGGRLQRLHGAFVSDDEVANVVEFWKRQQAPMYRVDFAQWGSDATQEGLEGGAGALADDPIYNDAVEFVLGQGQASISLIQRRFRIGFNKAARYVEQMEIDGFVGPANGSKPRPVIKGHEI